MPEGTSPEKQVEKKPDDSSVSTSTAGDGGGFNINQMLEQITRQQPSPKPSSSPSQSGPTIDLFASIGLCSNEIPEGFFLILLFAHQMNFNRITRVTGGNFR
jgi:hypothetical protein